MRRFSTIIIAILMTIPCLATTQGRQLTPPSLGDFTLDTKDDEEIDDQISDLGIDLDKELKIIDVETAGNRKVAVDDIRVNIGTRRGMIYDPARVARDIRALYSLGFFSDIAVSVREVEGGIVLTYTVKEKASVDEVLFEGNDEVDDEDIEEVIDLKSNKPLDVPLIHKNLQKIRDLYSEKGFFLAQVDYRIEKTGENAYNIVFTIEEHAQVKVRRVSFVGNHALSDSEISRILSTRATGLMAAISDADKFKKENLDRDMMMIQAYYWEHGYLNIKVGAPRVELSPDRRYIFLSIPLEEGSRYKVGRIRVIESDDSGKEIELLGGRRRVRSMVNTQRDQWFTRTSVMEDVQRITRHYQDHGYAHSNVDLQTLTRKDEDIVDLVLEVVRGPEVHFERIEIRGNTKTRDRVIRREVAIHEGEKYSQTGLDVSRARITQLGYFENVDVSTKRGSAADKMIVTVEVTEKHTGQFQVGMGLSSIEKFIAQAQITEQNFLGQGQTVSFQAQLSSMRQIFMLNFWEPRFLDTQWTVGVRLFNTLMAMYDYNKKATGGELTFGHPLVHRDLRLYLMYNLEYDEIDTTSNSGMLMAGRRMNSQFRNLPLAHLFREGLSSSLKTMLSFDRRNNRLAPTKGSFNSASVEWASRYIGSEVGFTRYSLTSRWYFPLFWKFVLRLNGQYGLIHSDSNEGLPIAHRYYSGGIMDVRGFYPRSLGPRLSIPSSFDPNAAPVYGGINIGGNMRVTFNFEIEFPLIEMIGIKGVVFFDAGNSFNLEGTWCQAGGGRGINKFTDPCNSNPLYLRTSAGFGFRWMSPMGPLRFEWGWPTHTFPGEDKHMFEFTFGNFF